MLAWEEAPECEEAPEWEEASEWEGADLRQLVDVAELCEDLETGADWALRFHAFLIATGCKIFLFRSSMRING